MDWQHLAGQFISVGLPAIGTLLGGPLGGTVGGIVGKAAAAALGVEAKPEAVAAAIAADPSAAQVKLAEIEAETKARQGELADIANARAMQVALVQEHSPISWGPMIFSLLNYGVLIGIIGMVAAGWLREDGIIVGFGLGAATAGYQFWLGSSDGSRRNASAMRQMASAATNTIPFKRAA